MPNKDKEAERDLALPNKDKEAERDLARAKRLLDLWDRLQPHTRRFVWARLHNTGDGCPAGVLAERSDAPPLDRPSARGER